MKLFRKLIAVLFLIPISLLCVAQVKVMTYNIRFNNPNDGDNWWENRKGEVVQLLDYYSPEIIGIQEGLHSQVEYIDKKMPNYNYVGVGRDDGIKKGEYTAVYFDTTQIILVKTKTFWLSETPDKVSIGWDASMERISTYAIFRIKKTGEVLHVFNCHYDHIGELARVNSSQLIMNKIKEFKLDEEKVIVMGDFNSGPDSEPIQILKKQMDDGAKISLKPLYGPHGTFNSFGKNITPIRRIDYIFTKKLQVKRYRHIDDKRINGLWFSDHLPVMAEIILDD
ncbi:endonuclease/exonuclease/phosphatase family protein [Saccharicrinis sp. 156]|uniref:endonuclease/exonuclease/phosphatase family protein n=1 Tax=Saccharicrinis sp. 156 TaxID=3417574 RepID=UPI003D348089